MADNKPILDATSTSFNGAADELADSSYSPKVTILPGDSSATPFRIDQHFGSLTETAPASDTASSGLNGRLQRIAQRITSFIALLPASLGVKAAAASLAVTLSTEDAARVGIVTETAPASDTASSGLNGRLQRIAQRLTSIIGVLPAALGGTTASASLPVVLSSDGPFALQTGSLTEGAPGTDTASSGLNGRLQRIAQRVTALIALIPASLGQKTMANSLAVAVASDQSAIPVAAGQVSTTTAVIADTTSLSAAVDLGTTRLAQVAIPASFEGGALEFQTSYDGTNYADLYDEFGLKVRYVAASSTAVRFPYVDWYGVRWMKFRSVTTAGVATVQASDATLNLALVPL